MLLWVAGGVLQASTVGMNALGCKTSVGATKALRVGLDDFWCVPTQALAAFYSLPEKMLPRLCLIRGVTTLCSKISFTAGPSYAHPPLYQAATRGFLISAASKMHLFPPEQQAALAAGVSMPGHHDAGCFPVEAVGLLDIKVWQGPNLNLITLLHASGHMLVASVDPTTCMLSWSPRAS